MGIGTGVRIKFHGDGREWTIVMDEREAATLSHYIFHSLVDLQAAINRFVREYNAANPQPFIWKAHPDDIIAARNRGFQTLESVVSQGWWKIGELA